MLHDRRSLLRNSMVGSLLACSPASLFAQSLSTSPSRVIDTAGGLLRGLHEGPVTAFRGIPYGADTARRRFMAPVAAQPWKGIRDCSQFGFRAPQGGGEQGRIQPDADMDMVNQVRTAFRTGQTGSGNESENCLSLNVFTPDASPQTKRPVMFWLHGGGFRIGSGGEPVYEGGVLAKRGDVVVVTINHRLNVPGYLYLGGQHSDFADSGNTGQLDQILALRWVRDNIAQFGGDPANVTIFGESGGGRKVATLLAMPWAENLFHKAIIQSGAGLRAIEASEASDFADRVLHRLGVAPSRVHALQHFLLRDIMQAAYGVQAELGPAAQTLRPVVDGTNLPHHPFDPAAPETSRNVPVIVGNTKDETTLFSIGDPLFGRMTADQVRARFISTLGPSGAAAFELYRNARPDDAPTYWYTSMTTDTGHWMNAIRLAERKHQQGSAPTFVYRVDWETPIFDGLLRSPHGIDTPMVFGHADEFARLLGGGADARRVSEQMMDAWIAFARSGNPSTAARAWPQYDPVTRQTMIFDVDSQIVADPDQAKRQFWSS